MHSIKIPDVPYSRRGMGLHVVDNETKHSILKLHDEFDVNLLLELWDKYSNIPKWDKDPVFGAR